MLKKIISVLILSAILVSSFGVIAFADDEIYPYSDTSIIPLSREEFLTTYAEQLGLSPDGSEIPQDDYIFLVRNEFGDYGDLVRTGSTGRLIRSIEFRITFGLDVEVDFDIMNNIGFLSNPMNLYFLHPSANVIGAFESYNRDSQMFPVIDTSSEPIVTEFFLFTKTENFSGIFSSGVTIVDKSGSNKYITHSYSSDVTPDADALRVLVDGEPSNTITVGEGGDTLKATYKDSDGTVLWETFVPVGLRAPRVLLKLDKKATPGVKYVFIGWQNYRFNVITENMTYSAEYATEPDPRGDVNEDGIVNTKDVVQLLKGLKNGGSGLDRERADVNLDGTVGYDDVTYMLEAFTEAREW